MHRGTGTELTEFERHALLNLAEEANEVAQEAIKILRFGKHDLIPGANGVTNTQKLSYEWGQLLHMASVVMSILPLDEHKVQDGFDDKRRRFKDNLPPTVEHIR